MIHIVTKIQTVFGILDSEGNVIEQKPVSIELARLNESDFASAFRSIKEYRDKTQTAAVPKTNSDKNV